MKDFKLENIPKKNLFEVPDGYFEKLPAVVMARVTAATPDREMNWLFRRFYHYRLGFASLVMGICFICIFRMARINSKPAQLHSMAGLPTVSHQDIIEYVTGMNELDSGDLTDLALTDTDIAHEFINASPIDILQTVDDEQLNDLYIN